MTKWKLEKLSQKGLKKKLKDNYDVMNCHDATPLSYEIASKNIRDIERQLTLRGKG